MRTQQIKKLDGDRQSGQATQRVKQPKPKHRESGQGDLLCNKRWAKTQKNTYGVRQGLNTSIFENPERKSESIQLRGDGVQISFFLPPGRAWLHARSHNF